MTPAAPPPGQTPGPGSRAPGIHPVAVAIVVAFATLAILRIKLGPVRDPDALWHILAGEDVWRTHVLVGPDTLNGFATNTWVRHEWLGELVMAGLHHAFGLPGVAWLVAAGACATFVMLVWLCRQRAGALASAVTAAAAWLGTSASLSARPQTISILLLGVCSAAWFATVQDGRPRWWLIPLTWVWACGHGLWFSGPLLGVAIVLGLALDRATPARDLGRLAIIPVASVAAAAFTPVGPRLLGTPFHVNTLAPLITEWSPADIRQPFVAATYALLVLVVVGWTRRTTPVPFVDILVWCGAFGWVLLYARTVAYGAVLIAPLAAVQVQAFLGTAREPSRRPERAIVAAGLACALILAAVVAPRVAEQPGDVPLALQSDLAKLPHGTVIVNDDALAGWLYATAPDLRPVIDTRTENFGYDYTRDYINARAAAPGWRDFVRDRGATAALLANDAPLVSALVADGWHATARGDGFTLVQAPPNT